MKKGLLVSVLLVLALVLVCALAGCGGGSEGSDAPDVEQTVDKDVGEVLTVGFIYIGSINDGGFTQTHHNGTIAMEQAFNGKVKAIWKEEVDDTNKQATTDAALQMIDQGAKVIIGTSFGFMDSLEELANDSQYADIKFLHFSGYKMNDTNFGNYFGATEEPRYLSGIVAGKMSKSGKLGYVAAFPYTEVQIGINAFALGAQSVNPDAEVQVVYINSWYDPANEKAAAEALLDAGCDVITQHCDTTGPQLAAANVGKFCIGYNLDNSGIEDLADAYLTAPIWKHEIFLVPTIQAILDGVWTPESYYGTMMDGYVTLAGMTKNVPDDVKAEVEAVQAEIEAGNKPIFAGPIKDNKGKEQVPADTTLDREGIWKIDYLVAGVSATGD